MASGPFDNELTRGLLGGRSEVRELFIAQADVSAALRFEAALAIAEGAEGVIPAGHTEAIVESLKGFAADFASLESAASRDGVYVPELVRQLRAHVGGRAAQSLHYGATSQDVIDTSLILRLQQVLPSLKGDIDRMFGQVLRLQDGFGGRKLMGVTRMQDALPITVSDRIKAWRLPLARHLARLEELGPRLLVVQFGGAVGTLDKLGGKGEAVVQRLAAELGLGVPDRQWHAQRDAIAEFASWLSLVTGSLGKMGQDIALMALRGGEIELTGGGGSSAMPHKQNPVYAETLVTLARFNAVQLAGMHQALLHEQERSGTAWTLEWMILPQMVMTTSAALVRAGDLLSNVISLGRGAE